MYLAKSIVAPYRNGRSALTANGFTLLEILIALAILAIGLAAAMRAIGAASNTSYDLKQRLLAQWVAQNRVAELKARSIWPDVGASEGEEEQAGQRFVWQQTVTATPNQAFRRVEVKVLFPGELSHGLATLVAYVHRPSK